MSFLSSSVSAFVHRPMPMVPRILRNAPLSFNDGVLL